MRIRSGRAALCILTVLLTAGCTQESAGMTQTKEEITSDSRDIFAMDTYMTLTAYGKQAKEALDTAVNEIYRLDQLLSVGVEDSEVSVLNREGSEVLSEDTAKLVERSIELYESTEGAFDITVYPLMEAWGFTTQDYRVPGQDQLTQLLDCVGTSKVEYEKSDRLMSLPEGVKIDLGAIAKGYASGQVMEIFKSYDIVSGLVSLGGNVQLYGAKTDGSPWKVAIEDPEDTTSYIGILREKEKAVITSGGYERYFEEDGVTWHHILDPRTGYPARSGLTSVTVVSSDGTLADGLSTGLFVMGKERALNYWKGHCDEFDAIFVEKDGSITVTDGLTNSFTSEKPYSIEKK